MAGKKQLLSFKESWNFQVCILYSLIFHLIFLFALAETWKEENKHIQIAGRLIVNLLKEEDNKKQKINNLLVATPEIKSQNNQLEKIEKNCSLHLAAKNHAFSLPATQYYSAIGLKYFYQSINDRLLYSLRAEIEKYYRDKLASLETICRILFNNSGEIESILLLEGNDQEFFFFINEKILASKIPSPQKFGLPHKEVKLEIKIDEQGNAHIKANLI